MPQTLAPPTIRRLTAKRQSKCCHCQRDILIGMPMWWQPEGYRGYHDGCQPGSETRADRWVPQPECMDCGRLYGGPTASRDVGGAGLGMCPNCERPVRDEGTAAEWRDEADEKREAFDQAQAGNREERQKSAMRRRAAGDMRRVPSPFEIPPR